MNEPSEKVQIGQKFRMPARTFNSFVDAAKYVSNQTHRGARPGANNRDEIILLRNKTDSNLPACSIVGIGEPIATPTTNLVAFLSGTAFDGVAPTLASHLGKFVILDRAMAPDGIDEVGIHGNYQVKVQINSGEEWYPCADIDDNSTSHLILRPYGAAQVLWKETGTGEKWATVRLGNPTGIVVLHGTLLGSLSQGGYANASLCYNGSTHTQLVYDRLMKSGSEAIESGKEIFATYFPDEQKFYVSEAECA